MLAKRVIVAALVALAALPATANAGSYDVYSCTLPNGNPAPIDAWKGIVSGKPGSSASSSCLSPPTGAPTGAMRAEMTKAVDRGDATGFVFSAPRYTTVSHLTLYRTAHVAGTGVWYHDFG